jgi:hypothetical protein
VLIGRGRGKGEHNSHGMALASLEGYSCHEYGHGFMNGETCLKQ